MRAWLAKTAALAAAVLVTGCGGPPDQPEHTVPSPTAEPTPVGMASVTVTVPEGTAQPPFHTPRQALVPEGWTISVFARMIGPRLAAWAPDDALVISVPSRGEIRRIGADGAESVLLEELNQPHGLAFVGDRLYVAESNQVSVYTYGDGRAANPSVLAADLPDDSAMELGSSYGHPLKTVVVDPVGAVYFSIGSTGNISAEDRDSTPPRASVMRIAPGGGDPQPFATGVRNATGLAVAPDGALWAAVNNRDNIADPETGQIRTGYVNEHPPESVALLTQDRDLGFPFCNPDGGPADLGFLPDAQTNPDGALMDCAALPPVEQSVPAHSAPLGMSFAELPAPFGTGALIGLHGSWNRTPPRSPGVVFLPWRDGGLGDAQPLVSGFQFPDGSRWGRPVAAVPGPDGAIYITDDFADAIYRLAPPS